MLYYFIILTYCALALLYDYEGLLPHAGLLPLPALASGVVGGRYCVISCQIV